MGLFITNKVYISTSALAMNIRSSNLYDNYFLLFCISYLNIVLYIIH